MLDSYRFALLDLETTGGQAACDQIMEVAVRQIDFHGGEERSWQSLIDPQCSIPPFIQGLTGISPAMVRGKPVFSDVQGELWGFLQDAVLVAHNARFDVGFLRANFARFGRQYNPPVLCTLKLARTLYPDWPKHGLEAICHRIGFYSEVHHRAMADVDAMKAFLDYALKDKGAAVFNFEVGLQLGIPELPPSISQEDIDAIPCQPGIYRLLGEVGELLYIGSATSLQTQILAHFKNTAGDSKAAKLARRVGGVQWQMLAGDLSTGLHASFALRHEKPQMQRRTKAAGKPCCLRFVANDQGDLQLRLRSGLPANIAQTGERVALFRDRKQAKERIVALASSADLCLRRLGVLAEGEFCGCISCCSSQAELERAGVDTETETAEFNTRVHAVFAEHVYSPWPFDEPVLIYEQNQAGHEEWHLVDDWRHYGSFHWDAGRQLLIENIRSETDKPSSIGLSDARRRCEQTIDFQYEHYRLLRAFLTDLEWRRLSDFSADIPM